MQNHLLIWILLALRAIFFLCILVAAVVLTPSSRSSRLQSGKLTSSTLLKKEETKPLKVEECSKPEIMITSEDSYMMPGWTKSPSSKKSLKHTLTTYIQEHMMLALLGANCLVPGEVASSYFMLLQRKENLSLEP